MSDNKKFSFIEEKISSNRKSKIKRLLKKIGTATVLALVFGAIAGPVFCVSMNYFANRFGFQTGKDFSFEMPVPSPEPSSAPTPQANEVQIIENKIGATIKDYENMYAKLTELAKDKNNSIVTVSGVVSRLDELDHFTEPTDVVYGLIVAKQNGKLFIISNRKRIEDVNKVQVSFFDGFTVDADYHDADAETDLIMLSVQLNRIPKEARVSYEVAELGLSEILFPGMPIIAIGNPNGSMFSMDVGLITGDASDIYILDGKLALFCTNLHYISDGDGIIINLKGKVIGIINHLFANKSNQDKHIFIGISELKKRIEQMINQKESVYVGIKGNDMTKEYALLQGTEHGIYVTEVMAESPAYHAGLITGDIITKVNGKIITSMDMFYCTISDFSPRERIEIDIIRTVKTENKPIQLKLKIQKKE